MKWGENDLNFYVASIALLLQNVFAIQHNLMPQFPLCAEACVLSLQHASYRYTEKGMSLLHLPETWLPLCADLFQTPKIVSPGVQLSAACNWYEQISYVTRRVI